MDASAPDCPPQIGLHAHLVRQPNPRVAPERPGREGLTAAAVEALAMRRGRVATRTRALTLALTLAASAATVTSSGAHEGGAVFAWGANYDAQLGHGTTATGSSLPLPVPLAPGRVSVSAGWAHSTAVGPEGMVQEWGNNAWGQAGNGTTVSPNRIPTPIPGLASIASASAGFSQVLALGSDGTVWELGGGTAGEPFQVMACVLGVCERTDTDGPGDTPSVVRGLSNVVAVAAGSDNLARLSDGTVWQWQTGASPTQVVGLTDISEIAVGTGARHLALRSDGNVWDLAGNGPTEPGSRDLAGRIGLTRRRAQPRAEGGRNSVGLGSELLGSTRQRHDAGLGAPGPGAGSR